MNTSRIEQTKIYVRKHFRVFLNEKGWKMFIFAAIIAFAVAKCAVNEYTFKMQFYLMEGAISLVSACIWIGIFNSIQTICKERAIIKREHRTGLHISSYVLSHLIFQAAICLIEALIIVIICIAMPGQLPQPGRLFALFFFLVFSADTLALAISSIVKTPDTAMTIMPFVLIFQLIFGGMIPGMNVDNFSWATISNYGMNAMYCMYDYDNMLSEEQVAENAAKNDYSEKMKGKKDEYKSLLQNAVSSGVESGLTEAVEEVVPIAVDEDTMNMLHEKVDENVREQVGITMDNMYDAMVDDLIYGSGIDDVIKISNDKYNPQNFGLQIVYLIFHILIYFAVSVIALKRVDKDKR